MEVILNISDSNHEIKFFIYGNIISKFMNRIHINPVGFIERKSVNEEDKNRSLKAKVLLKKNLLKALMGITDFFHIYVIFWMDRVKNTKYLHHPSKDQEIEPVGIFATRAPIHLNPIGFTLVELTKCEENVLRVRGIDAYDKLQF